MECLNCQQTLDPADDYCCSCGAKVIRRRITLRHILDDFSAQFLNYDNRFLQTFLTLFRRPEAVIDGYVKGLRKRYMNVLGYFAVAVTFAGFTSYVSNKFFPGRFESLYQNLAADENTAKVTAAIYQFVSEYQTFIMFAFIPVFALMSMLVFWTYKKYNYSEHLVINMYMYSHVSIFTSILTLFAHANQRLFEVNATVSLGTQILFFAYGFKRLFDLSWGQIFLRTLVFIALLIPVYIIMVIVAVIAMFLFTDFFDPVIEAIRAQQGG